NYWQVFSSEGYFELNKDLTWNTEDGKVSWLWKGGDTVGEGTCWVKYQDSIFRRELTRVPFPKISPPPRLPKSRVTHFLRSSERCWLEGQHLDFKAYVSGTPLKLCTIKGTMKYC